jgi:transposase
LFGIRIDVMPLDTASVEGEAGQGLRTRRARSRHRHGRGKLPGHLPRVRIEHDLPEGEKKCPRCEGDRHRIGEETSEQMEFVPASLKVLEHVRYKYACRNCEADGEGPQIDAAARPPQPVEKGLAGPGLLAYVAVSKLGDHLPLYRLEHILARHGAEVARSTMCAWMLATAVLLKPLYDLMADRVRRSRVVRTDEARVPVQARGQCRSGRIWVYVGDESNPYVVYDYTPDRTGAGPSTWLAGYKGYLQADAYVVYDGIYAGGDVVEVGCWAHARRKFFDARETDGRRAAEMLALVGELYAVEDEARAKVAAMKDAGPGDPDAARLALRQERSVPALARIKAWLEAERELVLPRSPIAAAIGYALNQWDALCVYATQGFLDIDNNVSERALKRVAVGRKNWLFAGSDRFGEVAATLYTLIATAERHRLDPQRYLTGVLARLPATPLSRVDQFLPDPWETGAPVEAAVAPGTPADGAAV